MRVMIFADTFTPQVNGVATSVATLAHSLDQQGHNVMVCTTGGFVARANEHPYSVVRVRSMRLPLYSDFHVAPPMGSRFAGRMRRFQPDVVHCHTPFSVGRQGVRAARLLGVPVVGTHHTLFGDYVDAYSRLGEVANTRIARAVRKYVATFYNQCDLVTCASRYLAADLAIGGLVRQVTIVPNPIDVGRFHPGAADAKESAEQRIVYCGRLAAEKNLPFLVNMMEPVLQRVPTANLEIIGDGPMRPYLERQVRSLASGNRITFTGWLHGDELVQHIARATVSISTSVTENQPMALLESLACGTPVVAFAAGGVPEIVEDGKNGYLVARDNPELMGHRIEQLIRDDQLRAHMRAEARSSAEAYSHAACLRRSLEAYSEAIDHRDSLRLHGTG